MDFQAPQFQNADILRSAALGQQMGIQGQLAPLEVAQQKQNVEEGSLKLDQLRLAMQNQQAWRQYGLSKLNGQQPSQQPSQQQSDQPSDTGATGGIQNGPQSPVSGAYVPPWSARDFSAASILMPDQVKQMTETNAAAQKASQAMALADNSPGSLSFLRNLADNPQAGTMIQNNPQLYATYPQQAKMFGLDPQHPSDQNVRILASMLYDKKAAAVGLPTIGIPKMYTQQPGKFGATVQTEVGSGQQTEFGRDPANLIGAANLTGDAKELAYQRYVQTGELPTLSRNPLMQATMLDYIAKRSGQDFGPTATQTVMANGQRLKAAGSVVKDFEAGQTSKVINGINTAVQHMDLLDPLIANLNNTDSPAFNKVANAFQKQVGSAAPTNFAAIKEFVGGEVAKAVLPGGGGEAERHALLAPLEAANSPDQLKQAVKQIQGALAGKTESLRNQWDVGTQGNHGSFDRFLMPATKQALGGHGDNGQQPSGDHPPEISALLDRYK